jgi:prolyl-tRNA synthetase
MRDGKALQMATSHELGQNFAKAFDIYYQSEAGQAELCFTTSWGASTRLVGGLVMMHGDDAGLVVPPRLAPIQVVVLAVRDEPDVNEACDRVAAQLKAQGVRVQVDRGRGSFGRRITDWEIKGVPLRVEVGPRDLAQGLVTMVRRDDGDKTTLEIDTVAPRALAALDEIQRVLYEGATRRLHDATVDVTTVNEALEAAQSGFARLSWSAVGEAGEAKLKTEAVTVRCLQRRDGTIPVSDDEPDLVCIVAKSY